MPHAMIGFHALISAQVHATDTSHERKQGKPFHNTIVRISKYGGQIELCSVGR